MSTKRLWAIAGAVAVLVAVLVIVANVFAPTTPTAEAEPTPTRSASPTTTPSASPAPTPTYTPPTVTVATCENTSTAALQAEMAGLGWTASEGTDENSPFAGFPNGEPSGAITCLWAADHNVGTDNLVMVSWAPIDPENAVAAMLKLEEQGFIRTEVPDGVYMSVKGDPGWADDEGWGATYYFGIEDVRWGVTKADVDDYIKAPTDAD